MVYIGYSGVDFVMKKGNVMRKAIATLWIVAVLSLSGCQYADSQLKRGPNGEDSKLEQEVKAAAPVLGPYGVLATTLATLTAGVYGAFHAREANKQTDVLPPKPNA